MSIPEHLVQYDRRWCIRALRDESIHRLNNDDWANVVAIHFKIVAMVSPAPNFPHLLHIQLDRLVFDETIKALSLPNSERALFLTAVEPMRQWFSHG